MSSINFDNPYLLLVFIPLLLMVFVPFIIAIKKENKSIQNVTSLVIHLIMTVLITLALAKTTLELVLTETTIYVLADCSYSSNNNLDLIDDYILEVKDSAPRNSKIGVITFANDYELLTKPGEKFKSVKESTVDPSQTNIEPALKYAVSLFDEDVIKRIVIISDAQETSKSNISSYVDELQLNDIYIDAIFLNNNLSDDVEEVQINNVNFTSSTYLNREEKIYIDVKANNEATAIFTLRRSYIKDNEEITEVISQSSEYVYSGLNTYLMYLDTTIPGDFNYELEIEADNDTSLENNKYIFTQKVSEKIKVLYINDQVDDLNAAKEI